MALLIGMVSTESVNKEKLTVTPSTLLLSSPLPHLASSSVHPLIPSLGANAVIDHSDLPTRFGDEDDVIESKAAAAEAEKKAAELAAASNNNGKSDGTKTNANKFDHFIPDSGDDYDDNSEFLGGEHVPNKGAHHDADNSESDDYDEEEELGPTLHNFGAKLDGTDTGDELPTFLTEPQSAYVVRSRPAILKCKAAHALQV